MIIVWREQVVVGPVQKKEDQLGALPQPSESELLQGSRRWGPHPKGGIDLKMRKKRYLIIKQKLFKINEN